MRHLLLVRHAKSAWDDAGLGDHDRPLAPRGLSALPSIREHLIASGRRPTVVLCSSAQRAVETLDGIRDALDSDARVDIDPALYNAGAGAVLAAVRSVGSDVDCAMVVGHNPTLHDLALALVGTGDTELQERLRDKLPTGAVVTLAVEPAWADLAEGGAELVDLFTPRPLRR